MENPWIDPRTKVFKGKNCAAPRRIQHNYRIYYTYLQKHDIYCHILQGILLTSSSGMIYKKIFIFATSFRTDHL